MLTSQHFLYQFPYIVSFVSFLIGLCCMPTIIRIARARGFVVKPNKRTSHRGAIPNIGGLNIYVSFFLSYLLFEYNQLDRSQYILVGLFVILIVGFTDDLIDLKPTWKLVGELIAGFFLIVVADVRITHLHGFMGIEELSAWISYPLSTFILIVIINALNLIDGVDGLASGLGIIYSLFFAIYFNLTGNTTLSILSFSLVGSLAVFFLYNVFGRSKRKIFMGDSGSLVLGYMLTMFVFSFCQLNAYGAVPAPLHMTAAPAVAIAILAIPLFDTMRVMLTRIKHGNSPFLPDKNHIHHLLLRLGLTHIQVTIVLLTVSLLFIGLALIGRNWPIWVLVLVILLSAVTLTKLLWLCLEKNSKKA